MKQPKEVRRIYLKNAGSITTGIGLCCVKLTERTDCIRVEVKGHAGCLDIPFSEIASVVYE